MVLPTWERGPVCPRLLHNRLPGAEPTSCAEVPRPWAVLARLDEIAGVGLEGPATP